MFVKSFVVLLSFIATIEAYGMCPDSNGLAGYPGVGQPCALVPGCNFPENGTLTPFAKYCSNEFPDLDCEALFPCPNISSAGQPLCDFWSVGTDPSTFPMVRSPTCLLPHLRDIAMKCAKQCALCCDVPQYNCKDVVGSPIDCKANKNRCNDFDFKDSMMQYCPETCSLCNSEANDNSADWNSTKTLCKDGNCAKIVVSVVVKTN